MFLIRIYKKEFLDNKKYIAYSLLLTLAIMLPQILTPTVLYHFKLIVVLTVFLFTLALLNRFLYLVLSLYMIVMNVLIVNIFITWGSRQAMSSRMEAAVLSPPSEKMEYLASYISIYDGMMILFSLVLVFFCIKIFSISYSFLIKTKAILISAIVIMAVWVFNDKNHYTEMDPLGLIYGYAIANSVKDIVDTRNEYLKKNVPIITTSSNNNIDMYKNIVLVMGEAANKKHMELYGYERNTTPLMSAFAKRDNFYKFDAISPTNQTRYSMSIMLTDATVHDFNKFIVSPSLITDFKYQGYLTYWLSNQPVVGVFSSYISSIADEANFKAFTNPHSNEIAPDESTKSDKKLLDFLDDIDISDDKKRLIFIHLRGSHAKYKERYPKGFSLYADDNTIVKNYDNSIYFTDYILKEIIKKFEGQNFLFVYLSDHGEIVTNKNYGHGKLPPYKDEFDIPFLIYSSLKNARLTEFHKKNRSKKYNLEHFNHYIKYISGLSESPNLSFNKNIISVDPSYIFNYDELPYFQ